MLYTGVKLGSPVAVRYPRGNGLGVPLDPELKELPIGKSEIVRNGADALIIGFGPITANALTAASILSKEYGIECAVVNARFAKPLDSDLLSKELPKYDVICTVEDHAIAGGFGSAVLEFVNDSRLQLKSGIKRFGVEDSFVPHGSQGEQHKLNRYDPLSIVEHIKSNLQLKQKVA